MNYVVLLGMDYAGYGYEKAFLTLEEAIAYVKDKPIGMSTWYDIFDLNTNEQVRIVD